MKLTPVRSSRRPAVAAALAVLALVTALVASASAPARSTTKPSNTSPPTISGQAQEGKTLTASPGTWSGTTPMTFSYQWRRCNKHGDNCSDIGHAGDQTYNVSGGDVGRTLRVKVTAKNQDGSADATSGPTAVVTPAPAQSPVAKSQPLIKGQPVEGQTLTADPRGWNGTKPIQFTFRWRRCDKTGGSCADISGATGQSYTLTSADVGNTLRVVVTGQNSGGSSSSTSDPTAVIKARPAPPPPGPAGAIKLPNGQTSIPVTSVAPPDHLLVDQIRYTPSRIRSRNEPLVARFHVMNEHGFVIRDALVYAVGVPFNRLSKEPETATAVDGWATISFQVLPTFTLRPGNLVVIFVRVRKPGENPLAGVSTRRLVSVRVG